MNTGSTKRVIDTRIARSDIRPTAILEATRWGSTLVQSAGHTWKATIRYMEINREGAPNPRHTLSPTPKELLDIQVSYLRDTRFGRFYAGIEYTKFDDLVTTTSNSDANGFIRWTSR